MEFYGSCEIEIPPIEIFSLMKNNIYNSRRDKNIINKAYIVQRKTLITLMNKVSNKMNFKSKTFFLAVNYLDIVFSKQKNISYNYYILAAACLIIASKFSENVQLKPTFKRFIDFFNNEINNNIITKDDLFLYEIIICKILEYKLNYFTIYDFNHFFFGNGILKTEHLKEINNSVKLEDSQIKSILIKLYEKSKYYLNNIINNLICLKYNSLLISICIMEKSIDNVLVKEFKREDNFNIVDIKKKNKKYFWQIMKETYKIEDVETSEYYQYLKFDCEKYKIFEDNNLYNNNNNNKDIALNKSQNSFFLNKYFNKHSTKKPSPKSISKNKEQNKENDEESKYKKFKKKNTTFLYKKVNIACFENKKNNKDNNRSILLDEHSPDNKLNEQNSKNLVISRSNEKIEKENTNNKITLYELYKNKKKHDRNSFSTYKDNYNLKKSSTTSSSKLKSFIINKIKPKEDNNIKRIDSLDSDTNSFDERKEINGSLIKEKNINITKPYKKKIIYNHEKNQNKNNNTNNNININININNRILYEEISKSKYRGGSSKKVIISKYIDNNNLLDTQGRNMKYKSKSKIFGNFAKYNFESSPIYIRNISKSKFNVSFKKEPNKDKSFNNTHLNQIYKKDKENNKKLSYKINKLNNINYEEMKNPCLTSRNSFQYPKHDIKFTDSFVNIRMNYFNNGVNGKTINIIPKQDKENNIKYPDNLAAANYIKTKEKGNINNIGRPNSNILNKSFNQFQNNINNNFNINFNYINENI